MRTYAIGIDDYATAWRRYSEYAQEIANSYEGKFMTAVNYAAFHTSLKALHHRFIDEGYKLPFISFQRHGPDQNYFQLVVQ
jgi:hypothetical protein